MHPGKPDTSPDPELPAPDPQPPDPELLDSQLDFFHKLGYSTPQVQAVQQTFGLTSDTDKVLGQLVRIGAGREAKRGPSAVTTVSVLVSRGDPRARGPALLLPLTGQCEESSEEEDALRPVVIDGSNVAMSHGNKEVFSCLGIQLAVNFFLDRGHTDVTVFVPSWRKEQPRPDVPITDQHILRDLERRKILVFTPSRRVAGKRVVCNDDCFIVKHGFQSDGVVVSNDLYRDLQGEKPEWKRFIEERLLMYSFVNNKFMPPDDPLGRHGPSLENFLRKFPRTQKKQLCPYGKKCTYGIKCKFHHPERVKQSNRLLADELRESAKQPAASHGGPGLSLLQEVEDMARKLSLNQEGGSTKKDHRAEQVKSSHRPGKKSSSRKEKSGRTGSTDRTPPAHRGSQEQLDSGLGSIDGAMLEAQWAQCDPAYGPSYGSGHGARQQFCQPQSAPCGSCSHAGSRSADVTAYGPPRYPGYCRYPVSMGAYSQHGRVPHPHAPHHHHHQHHQPPAYLSDPFPAHPARPQWDGAGRKEREVVRKKLLAIFSAQLVDAAMDMFPQVLDPQVLVAEILVLQSQNRSLR